MIFTENETKVTYSIILLSRKKVYKKSVYKLNIYIFHIQIKFISPQKIR